MRVGDDIANYGEWVRVECVLADEAADSHRITLHNMEWGEWLKRVWGDSWERMTGRRERVKGYKVAFCPRVLKEFDRPVNDLAVLPERKTPDTLRWLSSTVDHTIRKLANEPESRKALRILVASWLAHIDNVDD
jgi:hypothetical protein